jgi:Icc-related predicted phosphoesterase
MKILAFSDLHLAHARAADIVAASAEADLVIGAGDFCIKRNGLSDAMALLQGVGTPFVVVPGNNESEAELRAAAPEGVTVLHGESAEIGGLRFFGLGYGVPVTPFGEWSCDLTEEAAAAMLAGCAAADVFVLHSPPKGSADLTTDGASVGSTAIRAAIERVQPGLAVCGHIHDSWGREGRIGATRVVNLGPTVNWFEVAP